MKTLTELSSAIDTHLRDFATIDTAQEPYSYPGSCYPEVERKPNFPNLYISRSKDPALMDMQGEGSATITYKVRRRNVDEDTADGVPLYGADIEVRSIEPVKAAKAETDLSATLFLREFAESRDRDGAGRFAAGHVPSPTDYAVADAARKKKVAVGVGAGTALAGAALGTTAKGRVIGGKLAQGVLRAGSRLLS